MSERVYTGPRLTLKERAQLLEWIAEDPPLGYTEIKRRLVANGLPMVTRQAVNYFVRRHRKNAPAPATTIPTCPACGHALQHGSN
jgi:hypothetical protein